MEMVVIWVLEWLTLDRYHLSNTDCSIGYGVLGFEIRFYSNTRSGYEIFLLISICEADADADALANPLGLANPLELALLSLS